MSELEAVLDLVRRLDVDPEDDDALAVVLDWIEAKGSARGRKDVTTLVPLPTQTVGPMEYVEIVSTVFTRRFHFRKLSLWSAVASLLGIIDVRLLDEERAVIRSLVIDPYVPPAEPSEDLEIVWSVPGDVFGPEAPPTFDVLVTKGRRIGVVVTNFTERDCMFQGALLGS